MPMTRGDIVAKIGFFPPFYEPALETPGVLDSLWNQWVFSDLDNPLPELFREKLATLTSRFGAAPYCLVCHACSLHTMGMSGRQVYEFLQSNVLPAHQLGRLHSLPPAPWTDFPEADSPAENALLAAALSVFSRQDTVACLQQLRSWLSPQWFGWLTVFISYRQTCANWTDAYPDLSYREDQRTAGVLERLLEEEPRLAEIFGRSKPELYGRDALDFRALAEATPQQLFVADAKGELIYVNGRVADFFGVTTGEMLDAGWKALAIHPDDEPDVRTAWDHSVQTGQPFEMTYRLRRSDGAYRWFLGRAEPALDAAAEVVRWYGTHTDIHQARSLAEQLRESQGRLEQAVRAAGLGFWVYHVRRGLVLWSEQLRLHYGFPEGQLSGTLDEVFRRIHPEDRPRVAEALVASQKQGIPYHLEFRVLPAPDDPAATRWLECQGEVKGEGDDLIMAGTSLDINARVAAAVELREALTAAQAASSSKSSFLANMSHEIRTPLGAVMGFVELMKMPGLEPDELREYINVVERNSRALLRIIDDILDLSKVEAGKIVIELLEVRLLEWLHDFENFMAPQAREKGLAFRLEVPRPLPELVRADPTRLRQVLTNMVGNALKFTSEGEILVRVSCDHDVLSMTVTDTGLGLSPEQAEGLFQPFHQADASTTRRFGGTGLGLILTRRLCEAMGGSFDLLSSELGEGSCFRATVQVERLDSDDSGRASGGELQLPSGEVSGMKLLVVDDSPDNRTLLSHYLERAGAVVTLACDGAEALARLSVNKFDAVLMDVQMPNMDGREAARLMRERRFRKPVVALTAHAMKDEKERCLAAGFSHFLTKPVARVELLDLFGSFKQLRASETQ